MRARDFDRDEFLSTTWPEALESGEFEQGMGKLKDGEAHCCLGVGCELLSRLRLLKRKDWIDRFTLPDKAVKLLGILGTGDYTTGKGKPYSSLGYDNDNGKSFAQIARTIRKAHKSGLFEKPAESIS